MDIKINAAKLGMQLSKHPSELSPQEYSLMLNGNIQSLDGSLLKITNEPSNLLCSRFKPNFKVIGTAPINAQKKVIFFLVNPLTGESEIGEIKNVSFTDVPDSEVSCSDCNTPVIEDVPLEQTTQSELCTYTTLINADCLNFSLDYPVTATYQITPLGLILFFASKNNPLRYLELYDIPYTISRYNEANCNLPIYTTNLDCNKIKIVPDYSIPCINTIDVVSGGSLTAGVVQFTGVYAENVKFEQSTQIVPITDYFPVNNPTPIFEKSETVNTNYTTGKAVKIEITNLDTDFNYINLVVIHTIDNIVKPYLIGTFPINSNTFTYTYTGNNREVEIPVTLEEITRRRPVYVSARGVTEANSHLFWYDLEEQRPINLQPVINLLSLKWATISASEDFYKNPISNNYVSFERDEVVPFGIEFFFKNGFSTPVFPLVNREATPKDREIILPSDPNYIVDDTACGTTQRTERWQFYNTASEIGDLPCRIIPTVGNGKPSMLSDGGCTINPYKYGEFAYWESEARYPNNPAIWGDLCGQPIRHFKFPDNCVSPITNNISTSAPFGAKSTIYPIGVTVDVEEIKALLNQAVTLNLITEQDKLQIAGYRIKRGDRTGSKSIVAKGILTNMGVTTTYKVDGSGNLLPTSIEEYYPNYGFNDLRHDDPYLSIDSVNYPNYTGSKKFTFHSPETSYATPLLPTEIKQELIIGGKCQGSFTEVERHAKYVILSDGAYILADTLGIFEAATDAVIAVMGTDSASVGINLAIATVINTITSAINYSNDWLRILKSLGNPYNPAIFYTSVGKYVSRCCPDENQKFQQKIKNTFYLQPGNQVISEFGTRFQINNFKRESSVYLSLNDNFGSNNSCNLPEDNSKELFSEGALANTLNVLRPERNIKTSYVSLKNYVPDQYGTIDQISWIDTGFCGEIDWSTEAPSGCKDLIFGGDTYLTPFSFKKKLPFFVQDRVNANTNDDVQYRYLSNVGKTEYYYNTLDQPYYNTPTIATQLVNMFDPPDTNLEDDNNTTAIYHKGKLTLFYYSVPIFIVESSYNNHFRHAENLLEKNFYPNILDLPYWMQEFRVPISYDNYYFYNTTYSKENKENPFYVFKDNFNQSDEDKRRNHFNRIIYSAQNDWLSYSALDSFDFSLNDGKLIGIKGIEQNAVLVTQENATKIFNAYVTIQANGFEAQLSTGQMFAAKPREHFKTDLGFGGSNHQQILSTEYGHFFVDSQNPAILKKNTEGLRDVTRDEENKKVKQWFQNNLPFKILNDFPNVNVDNTYKDFGICLGWDNKFKRVFITKKDYELKKSYKSLVDYRNNKFYLEDLEIFPTDETYFINRCWTIAYDAKMDQFISFYSFKPNYYVSNEDYFSTGENNALWNHLLTEKSYQVFGEKLYPFLIEFATQNKFNNNVLQAVKFKTDFRRFQGENNWSLINNKTFTDAIIYNPNQSTGDLKLVVAQKNNNYQFLQYPKITGYHKEILVDNVENFWNFNQFNDIALRNGQPITVYKNTPDVPYTNDLAISYKPQFYTNPLRNDYFQIRLGNSLYSNYNILFHLTLTQQENSIS